MDGWTAAAAVWGIENQYECINWHCGFSALLIVWKDNHYLFMKECIDNMDKH